MNEYDIKRLALILAVQAEIEGGKAENKVSEIHGETPCYREEHFNQKAEELRNIANCRNEQL